MTINWVDIIDSEDFIWQVFEKSISELICHMIIVDDAFLKVYPLPRAQIFSTTAKTIIFPKAYKDFEDVFLVKNTGHLLLHKDHDHVINLVDGK